MKKSSLYIRRITVSAVFLSISLVIKTVFSFYIPVFGQNGLRFDLSGVFSVMPAILFGPVYGAVTAGLNDLLGYILKPAGAYLPFMTLAVALGGLLSGLLWCLLRKRSVKKMRVVIAVFSALLLALGILNTVFLAADGVNASFYDSVSPESADTSGMHLISRVLIERTAGAGDPGGSLATIITSMTTGLIASAVFGAVLLAGDLLISKKLSHTGNEGRVMQLLITVMLSGIVVSTLNTFILREALPSWKTIPFFVLWVPRIVEEILMSTVRTYLVAFLLGVYNRQRGLKELAG